MTGKKTANLTKAAVTAALYAALTLISASVGLAYGGIQFRLSEVLTVLPLFTPAAIPGLAVGCAVSNLFSTVNPLDIPVGAAATLLSAFLTRKLGGVRIKGFPFLSVLMPVIVNGVFIGAELTLFAAEKTSAWVMFGTSFLTVAAGEAAVCFTGGAMLVKFISRSDRLQSALSK